MAEKEPDKYLEMLDAAVKDSLHRLPTPHCEFITEGEQTTLVYKHQMGDFEVRFKPSKHLDAEALKGGEYLTKMMLDLEIAGKSIGELEESDKRREEYPQLIAIWFKMFFAHLLGNNAAIALRSTMRETDLITATFMQSTQIRPFVLMKGIKQIKASGVNEHLALILDETEKEKKEMLESYIFALQPTNLDRLREFYDAVYPVWHDIKDIAARYKDAWRGMIAAKYKDKTIVSDYTFESLFIEDIADDLLSRISGDVDGLTKAEEEIIERHDGEDTPSSIAIEHAARLCGAWRYQYKARTLFRKLKEQRNSGNTSPLTDTAQ